MNTLDLERKTARTAIATAGIYWIPTRPFTLVDAVNRMAIATGSIGYAMKAADASYNGHTVTVVYNSYRGYSICEHYWGERVVHWRGSMEDALRAGRREYDLDHRGTKVITDNLTPDEAKLALSLGYMPWTQEGEDAWTALWFTDLHGCASQAIDRRYFGSDTIHLLLRAVDKIDYFEHVQRMHADRLFGGGKWKECRLVGPESQRALVLSGTRSDNRTGYATVLVDGQQKLSGPIEHARAWWEDQLTAGWRVVEAAS